MGIKGKITRISKSKKRIQLDNKSTWYNSLKKINLEINDLVGFGYDGRSISRLKLLEKGINVRRVKEALSKDGK